MRKECKKHTWIDTYEGIECKHCDAWLHAEDYKEVEAENEILSDLVRFTNAGLGLLLIIVDELAGEELDEEVVNKIRGYLKHITKEGSEK